MSYCRFCSPEMAEKYRIVSDDEFNPDDYVSDVYVYGSAHALECCGCGLTEHGFSASTYSGMLAHLMEHRAEGHKVPEHALRRLFEEMLEDGDEYPEVEE